MGVSKLGTTVQFSPCESKPGINLLRHSAFFEALGEIERTDRGWSGLLSGLSALRMVDQLATDPAIFALGRAQNLSATIATTTRMPETDPARGALLRVLGILDEAHEPDIGLAQALMAYGTAFDLEARYALAADVFRTVSENFREIGDKTVVIESLIALGAAERNAGNWEESASSYTQAQHMSDSRGDAKLGLTTQVGFANNFIARGDLPAAESELTEVLAEAHRLGLQQVEAIALHARAYLAITAGDFQSGIHYGYRSLELTTSATARDRVLGDIAAAYAGLGLRDTARDGYSIVAVTSPHRWVRWQATLNLLELAIEDGDERVFDDLLSQVEDQPLDHRLSTFMLILKGRGANVFGRAGGPELLIRAREQATRHRLFQLAHEAEVEAERVTRSPAKAIEERKATDDEVSRIAEVIRHLRETATS
jgi:tetratricopeptide (TPR) repeat protein